MASGKTTLGMAAAKAAATTFIDLDQYIEQQQGMPISQIFATQGEAAFRKLERQAIITLAAEAHPDAIIACGGGTPCRPGMMEIINRAGTSIFLNAPREIILRRLQAERSKRPLVASLSDRELSEYIDRSLSDRLPFYSQAHLQFDSSQLETPSQIDTSVAKFLSLVDSYTHS